MPSSLLDDVRGLGAGFAARDAEFPERYPADSIAELHRAAIIAAPLTESLGGRGATCREATAAVELIARSSPSTALVVAMPLGLAGILATGPEAAPERYRTAWSDQIDAVAAHYRDGKLYAACNSEKGAGGSLLSIKTVAERGADGKMHLTGEKILASSGRFADNFFSTARVDPAQIKGAGAVELFFVATDAPGVEILSDWDGFGMRSTESQTVRYTAAPADGMMGFPGFLAAVQPLQYWFCLFAAIPLGCAAAMLDALGTPAPQSPALRLRLSDVQMRIEALRAYLLDTAGQWRAGAPAEYQALVLRTKTYVSQEATKLCAELFALSGGRHYTRSGALARLLADSFAGTALRPPLALALDQLVEQFSLEPQPVV
jgi:alkylation response protein AidB-like acyl-CoA dehydrogenase